MPGPEIDPVDECGPVTDVTDHAQNKALRGLDINDAMLNRRVATVLPVMNWTVTC